jgi:hypothetical protein
MQILSRYILDIKNPPKEGSIFIIKQYKGWFKKSAHRYAILLNELYKPYIYECCEINAIKYPFQNFIENEINRQPKNIYIVDIILWQPFIPILDTRIFAMRATAERLLGRKHIDSSKDGISAIQYISEIIKSGGLADLNFLRTPEQILYKLSHCGY